MTLPLKHAPGHTIEEYFRVEQAATEKHEYRDGEIVAVSGGTVNHSLITLNVGGELRSRLKGKPCRVYDSNLRGSTETYNRTKKFDRYREIESFHEYVLVAQDGARVETFFKQVDGSWALAVATGLDAIVKLRSIEISLPLAEIYDGIAFPPESSEEPGRVNE